jgi:hypothetical protein
MIAETIHRVAARMTWRKHPHCQPASVARWSDKKAPEECLKAWRARPWQGSTKQLVHYLLAVIFNESGFRRDVHAGVGKMSRGDPDSHGRGQSWGLGQRKLGASGNAKTRRGWTARQLAGLDAASTERSIVTIVDGLSRGYNVCRSPWGPASRGPVCIFGIYGGIWAATGDKRIILRVRTYGRIDKLQDRFVAELAAKRAAEQPDDQPAEQPPDSTSLEALSAAAD